MANYTIIGGDNKEYGPVTDADVRLWISEGRLSGESRVKAESDAEFRALAQFPEFADALKAQSTPGIIAPPGGLPAAEDPNWEANLLAREPDLKFGECLGAGWSFLGANFGFLAGAVLLAWVVNLILVVISVIIPIIGPFVLLCFNGVVMGGFYLACLRRMRGEKVSPADVFCGFREAFPQLLLTGLVSGLLGGLAACCLILPAVYLFIAWFFAVVLVADKKMFFWAGMELSRKVVTRIWFEMLVLVVIMFLPMLIFQVFNGVEFAKFYINLFSGAGQDFQQIAQNMQAHAAEIRNMTIKNTLIGQGIYLVNLFYATGVIIRAYENLFGTKKS
jgi:hypothetical protein